MAASASRPGLIPVAWRAAGDFIAISVLGVCLGLLAMAGLYLFERWDSEAWLELAFGASMLLVLLWWERKRPLPAAAVDVHRWPVRKAWLVGVLAGCVLLLGDQALLWLLERGGLGEIEASNDEPIRRALEAEPLLTVVSVGLLAPWLEERLIRGRLFARFRNAGHPWMGMLLTSGLFAMLHEFAPDADQRLGEWLALIGLYTWAGVAFCLLYLWSGRLSTAIAAHATNNLVACALLWLEGLA